MTPDLRKRAEMFLNTNAEEMPTVSTADVKTLVHELQVHQVELEMQNEELRRAQVDLARSRDAYAALYRNAPVGLCVLDCDLRFVRINERLAEINGLPAAEHIGKCVRDVLPELAEPVEHDMRRALATGEPRLDIEISGTTPAQPGVQRYWLEKWLPIRDDKGRVTGLNIVAEETTARKQAEQELRAANEELTKFNKAMVNRELRMIELKKEVNALLMAAGKAIKYQVPED